TSGGGGFHLFIFQRDLQPIGEWILLLKQVCHAIGAEISPGICEIFPSEKAELQAVGKAIRAPGTWNRKSDCCSEIEAETLGPLLKSLLLTWSAKAWKVVQRFH